MNDSVTIYDLAIIGSGFSGSLLATIARRSGLSVVLLEKDKHPRFAIGESSTPLANLLLERLASRYDLPEIANLTKWGVWQRTHPEIACGLKRGFTFFHHELGNPFFAKKDRSDQLLVAASPHDAIADTHWYRPDFDHFLLREAQKAGADYLDATALNPPDWRDDKVILTGKRQGETIFVQARFIIDATGPRGYLHHSLKLPEQSFQHLPATQGLYTHFSDVRRVDQVEQFHFEETPPYPIDDAAVHHVFDGGWIWVLRFNNGITSAGVAAVDPLADYLRFADGEPAWQRLLNRLPTVAEQFREARPLYPFLHAKRLSYCSTVVAGKQWALLPSAAGFLDPLLSTGFPLTLSGIVRLAALFDLDWQSAHFQEGLQAYALQTMNELLTAETLIGALYRNMHDFEVFSALSLLYFAAASFSETAIRLGRPELAGSFLMYDNPRFGPPFRDCVGLAMKPLSATGKRDLISRIRHTIEPFDIAGLGDLERRNWYPVRADDLFCGVEKLQASDQEIEGLLQRANFFPDHQS
jgi:FADH2 O2-dependent halogenase